MSESSSSEDCHTHVSGSESRASDCLHRPAPGSRSRAVSLPRGRSWPVRQLLHPARIVDPTELCGSAARRRRRRRFAGGCQLCRPSDGAAVSMPDAPEATRVSTAYAPVSHTAPHSRRVCSGTVCAPCAQCRDDDGRCSVAGPQGRVLSEEAPATRRHLLCIRSRNTPHSPQT